MDYSGLWKIMTDKNMTNAELMKITHISSKTIRKMKQGEKVQLSTVLKIAYYLGVYPEDIVDMC